MGNEEIIREINELMEDRGYSLDKAIDKLANVSGISADKIREIYEGSGSSEDPED